MRLDCPICGNRDRREFYYQGDAVMLARPAVDAGADAWDRYLHLRDNPAGKTRDLWHHEAGCGAWLVVTRDTVTHAVSAVELASDVKGAMA
jgi:sarcosine oxidase subunit delta